jgi:release factor glutamine methyltransferase
VQQENRPLEPHEETHLNDILAERATGRPLAYVLGVAPFWKHDWLVNENVLIPRPDSEILLTTALTYLHTLAHPAPRVAEVGIGSGCLTGSLLLEHPTATAVATDISPQALAVAKANFGTHGVLGRTTLLRTSLLKDAEPHGPFHLIFSNPPYIADAEWSALESNVRDHEPPEALTGAIPNADGLALYPTLIRQAFALLVPGGMLAVEMGATQADAVMDLFHHNGLTNIATAHDLAGRARVISGQKLS